MATYEATKYAFSGASITAIGATAVADGSVTDAEYQYINSLSANAQTQITARVQKAGSTMTGSLIFPDSTGPAPSFIAMGAGTDIKVSSDGTSGLIVGNAMELQTTTGAKYMSFASGGNINIPDDRKVTLGSGEDTEIYFDDTNTKIKHTPAGGSLMIEGDSVAINKGDSSATLAQFAAGGEASLWHNNTKRLATSAAGITVTGIATATTFSGSGASLTSLPAANVTGQLTPSTGGAGITLDYDSLPTSDPNVKGRLWIYNSGGSESLLAVSDG